MRKNNDCHVVSILLHELNFTKPRFETLVGEGVTRGRASHKILFFKELFFK